MRTSLLIPVLLASSVLLQAQEPPAKPELPPGPLIQKRAPEFSAWTISVHTVGADAAPAKEGGEGQSGDAAKQQWTTAFSITKTGKIYHVRMLDGQKNVWNLWTNGSVLANVPQDGKNVQFVAPPGVDSSNPLLLDFSHGDFQGFEWITASDFQGIKLVMGRNCLIFGAKVKETVMDSTGLPKDVQVGRVAYVDLETRLPVLLSNGATVTAYKFLPPPQAMQTMPESIKSAIDRRLSAEQSLASKQKRPY